MQRIPEMTQDFYVNFYLEIMQEILSVMTDSAHLAGASPLRQGALSPVCLSLAPSPHVLTLRFLALPSSLPPGINLQSVILAHLFYIVESGQVSRPLGDNPNNTEYVRDYVANLLQNAFPHLQEYVVLCGAERASGRAQGRCRSARLHAVRGSSSHRFLFTLLLLQCASARDCAGILFLQPGSPAIQGTRPRLFGAVQGAFAVGVVAGGAA